MDDQSLILDKDKGTWICQGHWDIRHCPNIRAAMAKMHPPRQETMVIDGEKIKTMDTAGAMLLNDWVAHLNSIGTKTEWQHFSKSHAELITLVQQYEKKYDLSMPEAPHGLNAFAQLGQYAISLAQEWSGFLAFVGKMFFEWMRALPFPLRWRWNELAGVIEKAGVQALPIIALLSFMIGVVISYQMGNQLRAYGANVFIVDLLGLSVLREFGPLITAIMVAGRTGSAFTAQLGIMKINQEIDALNVMGITPGALLILPRIIGLLLVMPLLTMWANIFGILGGMIMANNLLGISWADFLQRFELEIPLRALAIGLAKAPVFALIIASIGCFQGMQVNRSAESVGRLTTRSVVLAIFFIIVTDAIFSVIFSKLQL